MIKPIQTILTVLLVLLIAGCVENENVESEIIQTDVEVEPTNLSTPTSTPSTNITPENLSVEEWRSQYVIINPDETADVVIFYHWCCMPKNLIVNAGDVVRWDNTNPRTRFNVLASAPNEGYWDWQILNFRENVSIKFLKPDVYNFYNPYNNRMNGSILVTHEEVYVGNETRVITNWLHTEE
jgi:hypothetical protein